MKDSHFLDSFDLSPLMPKTIILICILIPFQDQHFGFLLVKSFW